MENIEQLIDSGIVFDEIVKIGEKHNLHIDQVGDLSLTTRQVALGAEKKEDFLKNVMERLEIKEDLAQRLIDEVNQNIFLRIRELLQQASTPKEPSDIPETPEQILKHIEDGGLELPAPEHPVVEHEPDLTEHLLENTVASAHVEEEKTVTKIPITKKNYSTDPYREPIN